MAAGIEQQIILENGGFTVEATVTETYDVLSNASNVTVGLRVKSAYTTGIQYLSGSLKLDGNALVVMDSTLSTHHVPIVSCGSWYNVVRSSDACTDSPWTMENVVHNTDGAKSVKLELELRGYGEDNYLHFRVAAAKTVTLTHIPRASTAGASDANIGAISTISVIRKSADYRHSIACKFGALSGYIAADGSVSATEVILAQTSIPFRIPESFYAQIPNSAAGTCTLTVRTYGGSSRIGEDQTTQFTVTAAEHLCGPQVSGRVEDANPRTIALTGDKNTLVRYASNALCTITAEPRNSASIASKEIGGVEVSENSLRIDGVEAGAVVFGCMDTRGYSAAATVKKPLVPYLHLTASAAAGRSDPTSGRAWLTVTGNWFQGSFGAADNALAVSYSINGGSAVTAKAVSDGNTYKAEVELSGLDYQQSHRITVTVADRLETVTKMVAVGKGIPVFDWGEDDFMFNVPVGLKTGCDILKNGEAAYAPAGYGLGEYVGMTVTGDCNDATKFGLYYVRGSAANAAHASDQAMLVLPYGSNALTQIAFLGTAFSSNTYIKIRKKIANGWQPWEWANPPMALGVEYRTAGRYNGTPVYTQLVSLGTTAESFSAAVSISGLAAVVHAIPNLNNTNCTNWDVDAGNNPINQFYFTPVKTIDAVVFYIKCGSNQINKNLHVQIWYTKN